VGNTADIAFKAHDEGEGASPHGGDIVLTAVTTPNTGVGYFIAGTLSNDDGSDCSPPSGLGSKMIVWSDVGCLTGLDFDTDVEPVNGASDWLCTGVGTVEFSLEQNGVTLEGASYVTSCQQAVSTPVKLTLEVTSEIVGEITTCPSDVTIEARVLDVNDDPLPDGVVISFVAKGGTLTSGFDTIVKGFASTIIQVPADAPPEVSILASATVQGVSLQKLLEIDVACGEGFTPSNVDFVLSSTTVECGTSAFLGGKVVNSDGVPVADGTPVKLIAEKGTLDPAETTTSSGMFTTTYKSPDAVVVDKVTVAVLGLFQSTNVTVTCDGVSPSPTPTTGGASTAAGATTSAAGGTSAAAGTAGANGAAASGIRPPNTGSAGLKAHKNFGSMALFGAALIASMLCAASLARRRA
jgi:hypothetical protein